ncbi:IS5 family transposase [Crenobacter caeni]|uniref:IS5 family transposase n=1 Tax=Crenobacter caeni TaxID=2705474 RepID=A0A6B2KRW1_9NEIS|nr:IS5 family transposase [Crenobacter caeni]NDV12982.1 IS5 family transposase [Crenobacter caeni]
MSKPAPTRYKTTNWAKYDAALKARGSLLIWLDTKLQWQAEPSGKPGRSATFSDAAIQFCLSIKCLFGLALRQTIGLVESLIKLAGLDWQVPNFSTLSRRQHSIAVKIPAQKHGRGLELLIDSTGIQFLGESEWKRKKHGAEYRRQWRKVHLGIDADTLEIRAIEVTSNGVGDAPMLPELLNQIPSNEPIVSVSADGAYDTKTCHAAIAARHAEGIVPVRKNGRPWKEDGSGARAWAFERQVAELQIRAALLNRFTLLGRPITVRVG